MISAVILALQAAVRLVLLMGMQALILFTLAGVISVFFLLSSCGGSGVGSHHGTTPVGDDHIQKEQKP